MYNTIYIYLNLKYFIYNIIIQPLVISIICTGVTVIAQVLIVQGIGSLITIISSTDRRLLLDMGIRNNRHNDRSCAACTIF